MHRNLVNQIDKKSEIQADCDHCFGLCCVALPFGKSTDFAMNKEAGTPCSHLQADDRCSIHSKLREKGCKGCTVYECFGAGQKMTNYTYQGVHWREKKQTAEEMFLVFPVMQQLHEMMYYLLDALSREETASLHNQIQEYLSQTDQITFLNPLRLIQFDIPQHRSMINEVLVAASELVRATTGQQKKMKKRDYIGAKLKESNLMGMNLRGCLFIACDLQGADLRNADVIGADFRDADLRGANLTGSIFLTQVQVNSARGDKTTKLPEHLKIPSHWL
ncbi:pentapeptide repeat-containing protein [Paenibacillus sp. Marseille-Q4541]|uniref:pentapeptide repeat-containing protein n=1 Tax=Paenibacillus sp. Marseille-Q4541 TaxID=2831522 RepID=UPI001BAD9AF1|nr:pentapeptide repeat-containing protein [Paenibacillus sp. Marseille-Q4541]